MKKLHVLIPSLMATISMPLVGLVGCDRTKPITKVDFNSCPWGDIIDACKKLYDTGNVSIFCNNFCVNDLSTQDPNDKKDVTSLNDFIGQTRTVKINTFDHIVIVLDCNKDATRDDNKTIFTFQFTNLISNADGNLITLPWGYNHDNYWNEFMHGFLNDRTDPNIWSVFEMIEEENKDLAANIRSVKRTVNVWNSLTKTWQPQQMLESLFEPTLSNLFSPAGIDAAIWPFEKPAYQKILYCGEGQQHEVGENAQYAYYQQEIKDAPSDYFLQHRCLCHTDINGNYYYYWLTTPILAANYTDNQVFVCDIDGHLNITGALNQYGVVPCFCL